LKILTDTHTLVSALMDPDALGTAARVALAGSPFTVSVANLWELVVKAGRRGALVTDPLAWWEKYVVRSGFPTLAILMPHVRALAALPNVHKDPFDRILIAQAVAENLTLATKDHALACHGVPVIWD
jgi:PIN domain nuclease of toxin-antitoxin system